jgi:hypothetical protein
MNSKLSVLYRSRQMQQCYEEVEVGLSVVYFLNGLGLQLSALHADVCFINAGA